MTALASFSFKSHVPKRFLTFLQTPACDQILVRAIEFARVFLRRTQATKSTSKSPSRTIAREQDAVTRLLSQEYVGLVRSESWSGPSNQRANHADAKFFEALFLLMDATLVRVLKETSPACMQLVHIEINRVLRSPTFNAARHNSEKSGASRLWCDLPRRRPACESKRSRNKKLPEDDRALGIVRAVKQKSPLVAVKCPSVGDKYKKYTDLTSKLRRDPEHSPNGIPGVPNRCVPTTQLCIIAKCPYCSVPRLAATQQFRMTQRVALETKWFTQEPHAVFAPVLLDKLRSLKFDAYKLKHEKTIDMAVTMMEDLDLLEPFSITNDTFISFLIDVAALHGRSCFTNWSHSVNCGQRVYYLLTTGGAAAFFSPAEAFAMMVSAFCSGSKFPGNDPIVVSSSSELWMLQRDGSPHVAHYKGLSRLILSTGGAPHCNVFKDFKSNGAHHSAMSAVQHILQTCTQGMHILPMTKKCIELPLPKRMTIDNNPSGKSLKPASKVAFAERLHNSRGSSRGVQKRPDLTESSMVREPDCWSPQDTMRMDLITPSRRVRISTIDSSRSDKSKVKFKQTANWQQEINFEMMQLIMMASWLFYAAMPVQSAMRVSHKFHQEMFLEGDKQAALMPVGARRADCIAPCCDRKALDPDGAEERVHATFVDLVILPLHHTLNEKLKPPNSAGSPLNDMIENIKDFHHELVGAAHMDNDKHLFRPNSSAHPLSKTMPLPQMSRAPSRGRVQLQRSDSRMVPSVHYKGAKVLLPGRFSTIASASLLDVRLSE